jgi:phosphoribosylamine-glycine ligase
VRVLIATAGGPCVGRVPIDLTVVGPELPLDRGTRLPHRDRAYEAVSLISFDGMQYRRDIGQKAL